MPYSDSLTLSSLEKDPDPILAELRKYEPVCFVPALEMWFITKWEDVAFMESHPEIFSADTNPSFLARALGPNMLTMDKPNSSKARNAMLPAFQAGGVAGSFASARLPELIDQTIDKFIENGKVEIMKDFATPISASSLAIVLGLDSHAWEEVWEWCEGLCADIANFENDPTLTNKGNAARDSLGKVLNKNLEELSKKPNQTALSTFLHSINSDPPLSQDEIVNNVRLMISGGINEPRDGIGLVVKTVLENPQLREELLENDSLWRKCVEEVFRLHSPVGTITRQTKCEVKMRDKTIPANSLVSGILRSANRDEEHWSNPDLFDLHRKEGPHAAFALGEHRCLGEWLGRQVVKTASQRLFTRIEGFELEPDFEIELKGFEFRGPLELNCVWGKHV